MPVNKKQSDRLKKLVAMMKENRYPNHSMLEKAMQREDIAGAYNISQKTIQRDVKMLREEYNAPIKYCSKNRGYCLIDPDWSCDAWLYDDNELRGAVLGARLAEIIMPEPLKGTIRNAVDSMLMQNEKGMDEHANLRSLMASIPLRSEISADIFSTVFDAWSSHHTLKLTYRKNNGETSVKRFDPHVLVMHGGHWYTKGEQLESDGRKFDKTFYVSLALHRIVDAEMLDTIFESDPELIEEVEQGGIFSLEKVHNVDVWCSKGIAGYVKEQYVSFKETITVNEDGSLILHIPSIAKYELVRWILSEGGDVIIINKPGLAAEVIEKAKLIIEDQKKYI
jgi:predicted DNA-binding transcriptional regulator YafY